MNNRVTTGVILAGGLNTRYPVLKAFVEINGLPLIVRTLRILKNIFPNVLISTNAPEHYFHLGVPMIGDIIAGGGPMSGFHAGLMHAQDGSAFFVACDMPFLAPEVVEAICRCHTVHHGPVSATIACYHGRPQPLCGVYSSMLVPAMEAALLSDRVKIWPFLEEHGAIFMSEETLKNIDPEGRSFVNINTVEDYAAARELAVRTVCQRHAGHRVPNEEELTC
ncbi:MAG TPA: molybdenum cofactor guanylyltransferase [Dissulfurispiraceae bacterium]|nr:molybdenum cofactor guanylyltransferase [Dissulfurispiraceae bacterium]